MPSLNGRLSSLESRSQQLLTVWLEGLTDAELAAVAGDVDPDVSVYMDSLPDAELQALAEGEPDALRRFWLWQRRQAGS